MKKTTAVLGAALAFSAFTVPSLADNLPAKTRCFPYAPKAKAELVRSQFGDLTGSRNAAQRAKQGTAKVTASSDMMRLPACDLSGYLDGPKGEVWLYTVDYDWDNGNITGFTMNVYDSKLSKLGTVRDALELSEGESRIVEISVGTTITQKFFNSDAKYEIMVGVAANTPRYVNTYKTRVYAISDLADGEASERLMSFDGYYCSAVNAAKDDWSEDFYITFLTEEDTETPEVNGVINAMDYRFVTYKKAGYGGMKVYLDTRFPQVLVPGANAVPFLSAQKDGIPYFAVNHLKYSWYLDPFDYETETPTPDNELIVKLYSPESSWASEASLYSTTRFPLGATEDNLCFLYAGAFSYDGDVTFDLNEDGTPAYYITRAHSMQGGDYYLYDYEAYDAAPKGSDEEGVKKFSLAEGVEGGIFMSDVRGFDPQVMFAYADGDTYSFQFVNTYNGNVEATIPYTFNGDNTKYTMNTLCDRIASGDSYVYTVPQTTGQDDANGDTHTWVVFASPAGDITHVDDLNLGARVDLASLYSGADGYNPYIFNLDDDREYMVLLKRRNESGTTTQEEFSVISSNPDKGVLFNLGPDDDMGILLAITLVSKDEETNGLAVCYVNQTPGSWKYTTNYYPLPLTLFEAGDGTLENPYQISTVGGLKQIKREADAHYVIVNDIDASSTVIKNADFNFTGSLDGQGYVVSNLRMEGRALLPTVTGTVAESGDGDEMRVEADGNAAQAGLVRNINLVNPRLDATADKQGLIAGSMMAGKLTNVHAYGATVNSNGDAAGLVGNASLNTVIDLCSFDGDVTTQGVAGGIAGITYTGATINACAVKGTISGDASVGGVVGEISSLGGAVSNCHVNANVVAKNTVGGIAGTSIRTLIERNHVQGTVKATECLSWGGGAKAGGVLGSLDFTPATEDEAVVPVVTNNFVNLTSLEAPETPDGAYPAENTTVHRIVGGSRANVADPIDYDDNWNPIYSDPMPADLGLVNNYVISTLPAVEEALGNQAESTEGKDISADALGRDFFENTLSFGYGYEAATPWSLTGDEQSPRLYFETGLLLVAPASVLVEQDQEVTLVASLEGEELTEDMLGSFTLDYDEALLECTYMEMADEGIRLTFKGLAEGVANVTVGLNGLTAKAQVTVTAPTAIAGVAAAAARLAYDGRSLRAEGAMIDLYSVTGAKVLSGRDQISLSGLPSGIYVAKATLANGKPATIKIRL